MNRRCFNAHLVGGAGALVLGSWAGTAASGSMEAAPGWSSASAARRLTGVSFRVDQRPGTLELVDVVAYGNDDRQFTARFRRHGAPLEEGIYRLRAANAQVDLFLQPVFGEADAVDAVISHARG